MDDPRDDAPARAHDPTAPAGAPSPRPGARDTAVAADADVAAAVATTDPGIVELPEPLTRRGAASLEARRAVHRRRGDAWHGVRSWWSGVPDRVRGARVESWVTFVVVGIAAGIVFVRMHPSKIFLDTLPAGGDMGAHVWGPAYLRDNLLPNLSFRGWTQDWYAGFPALHFYMVLPYLLIVLLDVVLPYGVAFKLIAVAGVTTIPISAYVMGRLARLPFPLPALLSVAGLLYVFDFNFTIYGGNIASTLAGEFAFSLSLSFSLVFLGYFIRGLDDGTHRGRAALFLALTALSHLIPLAFAVGAAIVIGAVRNLHRLPRTIGGGQTALVVAAGFMLLVATFRVTDGAVPRLAVLTLLIALLLATDVPRAVWALTAGIGGLLLSAFWVFPFIARRPYLNDMGWEKLFTVRENLFFPEELGSGTHLEITWVLVTAGLGVILGVLFWERFVLTWTGIAAASGFAFVHWPQNRLWNARFLGFWYLALYVLAACGLWLLTRAVGEELRRRAVERDPHPRPTRLGVARPGVRAFGLGVPLVALVLAHGFLSLHLGLLPGGSRTADGGYAWGPLHVAPDDMNFVSGWANWNFSGYERKQAYPEYYDMITTMDQLGDDRGCGRAMWEFGRETLDRYGTPMAPMLLPHFTDGCIASMEGLYFETSSSVAHHFLLQSELSQDPSRPMRDLPYSDFDIDEGIDHMRIMGVRYYMAFSDTALAAAAERPEDLVPVAQTDTWTVYELTDTSVVSALDFEPAVVEGIGHAGREWTDPSVSWFNDARAREVVLVDDGPSDWARVALIPASDLPARAELAPRNDLPPVEITDVVIEDDRVSFRVDRTGVPVIVRVGYFPNWEVSGAPAIHRATPNFMVVVPTDNEVVLTYSDSRIEYAGYAMTIIGIVGLWWLHRSRLLTTLPRDPDRFAPLTVDPLGEPAPTASPTPGEAGRSPFALDRSGDGPTGEPAAGPDPTADGPAGSGGDGSSRPALEPRPPLGGWAAPSASHHEHRADPTDGPPPDPA